MKRQKFQIIILATLVSILTSCGFKFSNGENKSYYALPANNQQINQQTIDEAKLFLSTKTQFDAFTAIKNDSIILDWGCTDTPIMTHSARKSIISVLYGIAIEKGLIRLDQTLDELGIDESKSPLSALEKTCTIRDLLMSRSGIYLEASGETAEMKAARPKRGSHKPGEFYYYNNWGFNVLGTIFEKQTKMSIGNALYEWLAIPLGMKHFRPNHINFKKENYTEHRQYIIFMTASDMARIGLLILNDGICKGKTIVSKTWVEESTYAYSKTSTGNEPMDHYGYLWWIDVETGNVWASGWGGQFMIIDKKNKLVTVSRNDTGRSLIQKGLFIWKGKQGFRDHHQKLHEMMLKATE